MWVICSAWEKSPPFAVCTLFSRPENCQSQAVWAMQVTQPMKGKGSILSPQPFSTISRMKAFSRSVTPDII